VGSESTCGRRQRSSVGFSNLYFITQLFNLHFVCVNADRINWSGSALSTFYAAIRKALVVVIVARALGIIFGIGFVIWWISSQ